MIKVTTKDLEIAVLNYEKHAELKSLRTSLPWECDVLTVTKDRCATEWELKISRSDFKADFKKPKHRQFRQGDGGYIKRFWYVVPQGLVDIHEIPSYAGLMYYYRKGNDRYLRPVKYPATLDCQKLDEKTIRRLYRSMMFRFLKLNFPGFDGLNFVF